MYGNSAFRSGGGGGGGRWQNRNSGEKGNWQNYNGGKQNNSFSNENNNNRRGDWQNNRSNANNFANSSNKGSFVKFKEADDNKNNYQKFDRGYGKNGRGGNRLNYNNRGRQNEFNKNYGENQQQPTGNNPAGNKDKQHTRFPSGEQSSDASKDNSEAQKQHYEKPENAEAPFKELNSLKHPTAEAILKIKTEKIEKPDAAKVKKGAASSSSESSKVPSPRDNKTKQSPKTSKPKKRADGDVVCLGKLEKKFSVEDDDSDNDDESTPVADDSDLKKILYNLGTSDKSMKAKKSTKADATDSESDSDSDNSSEKIETKSTAEDTDSKKLGSDSSRKSKTLTDECRICDQEGHTSFQCQMVCRNCSAPYHNLRSCPSPPNLSIVMESFMEFCLQQFRLFNPNLKFAFPMNSEEPNGSLKSEKSMSKSKKETKNLPSKSPKKDKCKKTKRKSIDSAKDTAKAKKRKMQESEDYDDDDDDNSSDDSENPSEPEAESNSASTNSTTSSESESSDDKKKSRKRKKKQQQRNKKAKLSTKNLQAAAGLASPFGIAGLPTFYAGQSNATNPPLNSILLQQMLQKGFGQNQF